MRKAVKKGIEVLKLIDAHMLSAGISRNERRHFWREFNVSEDNRDKILRNTLKHLKLDVN
jgi:hypothetical protein